MFASDSSQHANLIDVGKPTQLLYKHLVLFGYFH